MPIGPNGEKRPTSSVSSMVMAMKVATGIEKEQYVEGKGKPCAPEERIAAMQIAEAKPKKSKKRRGQRPSR